MKKISPRISRGLIFCFPNHYHLDFVANLWDMDDDVLPFIFDFSFFSVPFSFILFRFSSPSTPRCTWAKNLSGVLPSRQWFIGPDAVPGRHYTPQRLKHGTWRGCGMCHENEKRIKTIHTFAIRQHIIQHESHQFFVSFRLENKIFNSGHWWTAWKGFLQLCHGHLQQQELSFDTHQFHARSCSHACQRASWAFH